MAVLDISEVSRRSSFTTSALRYYEEKGLIRSIGRRGIRIDRRMLNEKAEELDLTIRNLLRFPEQLPRGSKRGIHLVSTAAPPGSWAGGGYTHGIESVLARSLGRA